MPTGDGFFVRTYKPGDEIAIQELHALIFGRPRTSSEWEWRFRKAPSGRALIIVLETEGAIVGHIAHVGFETIVEGRKVLVGHGGDTMVRPDKQGRGGMRLLVEGFLEADHGFDARMNFPTDTAARLMDRYGGGHLLGRLTRCVRWRRLRSLMHPRRGPRGLKPHLLGNNVAIWLRTRFSRAPEEVRIRALDHFGPEADDLAQRCARQVPCMRVRDAAYMTWRWLQQPDTDWRVLAARDARERLQGVVVFGVDNRYPWSRFPAGQVVDVLSVDESTTRALLSAAADSLFEQGCRFAVYEHHDPRPWSPAACRAAGFVTDGRGTNVVCGALSENAGPIVENLGNWYLTKGDTDLA